LADDKWPAWPGALNTHPILISHDKPPSRQVFGSNPQQLSPGSRCKPSRRQWPACRPPDVAIEGTNRLACVGPIEIYEFVVLAAVEALPAMASGEVVFRWARPTGSTLGVQYRIVFRFEHGDAFDVQCTDYH
jgi:hypothetical protein